VPDTINTTEAIGENVVTANTQQKRPSDPQDVDRAGREKRQKPRRPKFPTREQFDLLVKRADDGDRDARDRLRKLMDAHPQLWKRAGDLAVHAQLSLIRLISKEEWFLGESIGRRLEELRRDLEAPFPTPLEKLAIERVVAAWANLYCVETIGVSVEGDLAERNYWLKKQDQAHRQYLSATKSLMLVQGMLERSPPALPITSTSRLHRDGPSGSGGSNGTGGNGHVGDAPVPAFGADDDTAQQRARGNGFGENRIASLVGVET
jgi:hypothetical protein